MASVSCPACQGVLQLPADCAASAVRCPKCKNVVPVRDAAKAAPPKESANGPAAEVVSITCPACSKTLRALARLAGQKIRCTGCQGLVKVPGPVTAPADSVKSEARQAVAEPRVPALPERKERPRPAEVEEEADPPESDEQVGGDPFQGLGVPEPMQEAIREQLEPGEEIVWVGRPMSEILIKKARFAFFLGILLALVGVGGITTGILVSHQVVRIMGLCLGGFFALISIPCMLAPFLTGLFDHKRPCYVVTPRRAIIYYGGLLGARSYDRRQLMVRLDRQESGWAEGAGSLIFDVVVTYESTGGGQGRGRGGVREDKTEYGFLDVANVAEVEKIVRDTIIKRTPGQVEERSPAPAEKKPTPSKQAARAEAPGRAAPATRRNRADEDEEEESHGDSQELVEASEVHESLKARILRRLTDDERATWVGRPLARLVFLRSLPPAIMTMVMAAGMAFFITRSGAFRDWWVFLILGGVFLIGLLMPAYRVARAHFTAYVLTTRRCLVFEPNAVGMMEVTAYLPDIVSRMRRRNAWLHKGGGDLIFRTKTVITTTTTRNRRTGAGSSSTSVSETHYGFLSVGDVARVEKLVNRHLLEPYLNRVHGV